MTKYIHPSYALLSGKKRGKGGCILHTRCFPLDEGKKSGRKKKVSQQ
jgi:hypothetical protein